MIFALVAQFLLSSLAQAQVSNPVFTPPSLTRLPVVVSITNSTAGSQIYITVDGTVPTTNSVLYTGPFARSEYLTVRARAFASGQTPSDTISAQYLSWDEQPEVSYLRTVTNDVPDHPLVTIQVSGVPNAACFTIEERLSGALQAASISSAGNYLVTNNTVRWGPFTNTTVTTVSYRVTGAQGVYQLDGSASVDGAWWFTPPVSPVTISSVGTPAPTQPPQVATPVLTPATGTNLPVNVTISCATTGAVIYYTLDGTVPTEDSENYREPLQVAVPTTIRARAFKSGWTPSTAAVGIYGSVAAPVAQVTRTVNTNAPATPVITLNALPTTNAACFTLEERLPLGLSATNVTSGGLYLPSNNVVRWGPFFGTNAQMLGYQAIGAAGTYAVRASWSVDGVGGGESVETNLTVLASSGIEFPVPPLTVTRPVLSPSAGSNLPVTVTISCTDTLAQIYFTTDGSVPTQGSSLYSAPLLLTTATTLRSRTYRSGYQPSAAVVGNYVAALTPNALLLVRSVSSNASYLPAITIAATPQGNLSCYSVTESIDFGLTPYSLTGDAVWNSTNRTIRWGPYRDNQPRTLGYQVSGPSRTNALAGEGSFDGFAATITGATSFVVNLNTLPLIAAPVILPAPNGIFPSSVTITSATPGAIIYYTLDGSVPTRESAVYSGPFQLNTIAHVRAWAYLPWGVPSAPVSLFFGDEQPAVDSAIGRTIIGNNTAFPLVQMVVAPGAAVKCYAVSEALPSGLTPWQISAGGVFNSQTRQISWGPFLDSQPRTVAYRLSGADASYTLTGTGSFDGFGQMTPGDRGLIIVNLPYITHAAISNWTFSATLVVTARPPASAACYTVEEFLPLGFVPTNITHGGAWDTNTLAVKWGPFVDATARTLSFTPVGPFTNFTASGRMSVDGVSYSWDGDAVITVGLSAPQNLTVIPGNQALYVSWSGSGHEAGYKLNYWTLTNRSDRNSVLLGPGIVGFQALQPLQNGTNYFLAMTAIDAYGAESAQSVTVSARPNAAAGVVGQVAFDTNFYASVSSIASLAVWDVDLNTNATTAQRTTLRVFSDSDTNGLLIVLKETGTNTGVFTSAANGTNLSFTFDPSDSLLARLQVKEGDLVYAIYYDLVPVGQRLATAQFMQFDSNGNGVPDWWERVHFDNLGIVTTISDSDHDGMPDVDEYVAGTDPLNPSSMLSMADVQPVAGGLIIVSWQSVAGKQYVIEKSENLEEGFYPLVVSLPATAPISSYTDVWPSSGGPVFYRVRIW